MRALQRPEVPQKFVDALPCYKNRELHTPFGFSRIQSDIVEQNSTNVGTVAWKYQPRGYWSEAKVQRDALEKLGIKLGVKELNDWYSVSATDVYHQLGFLKKYSSLFDALKKLYPQHDWNPLHFSRKPHKYWSDESIQREALEKLGNEKFGVKELNDWYKVIPTRVYSELDFVKLKHGSLYNALKKLYPQHDWDPKHFTRKPQGYWNDEAAQREGIERLGRKLGVKELNDWYKVSSTKLLLKLSFIQTKYGSLYNALKHFYPTHHWDPLRFSRKPQKYWSDENAQRDALERLGREHFGVKELDDWYSVTADVVYSELGFIRAKYGSLLNALKHLYPQHDWDPLLFSRTPRRYWQRADTVQHYRNTFTQWKQTHDIRTVRDWYELPPQHVNLLKRVSIGIFGSTKKMLETWFPETIWQSHLASQLELQSLLKHVLSDSNIKHFKLQLNPSEERSDEVKFCNEEQIFQRI